MTSKYRALAWVIAASSIIATCMVFTFRSYGQIEAAANANKYAHEGVSASHEFMDHLKDAEISQRGYVLTGEESQLMLYLALKGNLPHELKALRLRAVAAEASVHLNAAAYLLDAKLAEMARAVVLRQSKTFGAMTSQAYGGEGSGLMDGIRAEFQAFDRIQGEEQLQIMAEFDASMRRMLGGIVSMSVLGVLFALYFVNQFFCAARAQARARQLDAVYRNVASENAAQRVLQDSAAVVRQSSALQHAIFNSANFSYISTDAQGLIQVFNMGSEMMLDYTSEEMVGKTTPASICGADELTLRAQQLRGDSQAPELSAFEALVYKAARGMEDIFEVNYCHKSGAIVPVILSVNPLYDADNTVIGYLFIGIDNRTRRRLETERTHLNQVLRDRNTDLESARAVAERANQAKSDFLSSMSHELRSPLNAILGFAQLMESGLPVPTPQQQANIEQILRAGWYLLELINEVLDLALVESGRLSMSIEPVRICEALTDCKTMMEPLASARGITLQFAPLDATCFAAVDRTRFKQVLVNLLSNAIKYNRPSGLVNVVCLPVGPGRVRIRVSDTGHGLPAAKLDQLFQPFNRLGQEEGVEHGTGIGLVVCKRLVELMGGQIGATSRQGNGSEFWIEINRAEPPLPEGAHSEPAQAPWPALRLAQSHHGRSVLYIEDNQANVELVTQIIARSPDVRLLLAGDGPHGVALAVAEVPDLVLMDMNLPGMDGLQAMQLLRENPVTRHIPVIALSANAMPHFVDRAIQAGCIRYLTKPIKLVEFVEALEAGFQAAQTPPATQISSHLAI